MSEEQPEKHAGGAPLKFTCAKEVAQRIDKWIEACIEFENGIPIKFNVPLTLTRLALYLGCVPKTIDNYRDKKDENGIEFLQPIQKAMLCIQLYTEDQLHSGKNVAGAIFSLTNNFGGTWKNKQHFDHTTKDEKIPGVVVYIPDNGRDNGKGADDA